MAKISFVVPSVLNAGGGEKKLEVDATTLRDALRAAVGEMGEDFARKVLEDPKASEPVPRALVNMYINGKNAQFSGGLGTKLSDGDEVYLLPAVAGGSDELSSRELDRYSRQVMLEGIGYEGQLKLRASRVCIIGAGGLGHPIAARLVGMGVGHVRLVDRDVIELSNLHRQVLFTEGDVGKVKVEVAAERLRTMNADVTVEAMAVSVSAANAASVIEGCDVVIDALDSVNARYALNRACVEAGIPLVSGAAVGVSGQALTIVPEKTACYHCVFPALDEDAMPTCSIEGVNPAVLSIVGGIEASEAARLLTGKEPALAGRLLHVDIDTMDFSTTRTFRADECTVCGTERVHVHELGGVTVEELCGRNRGKRTFALTPPPDYVFDPGVVLQKANDLGHKVHKNGAQGFSISYGSLNISLVASGSAVIVGANDANGAISIYNYLLDRHADALTALDKMIAQTPNNAVLHRDRALALYSLGRSDEALVAVNRAISLNPDADSYSYQFTLLNELGRSDEALVAIDRAISLNPNSDVAYSNKAVLLHELGRSDEALVAIDRAISIDFSYSVWHKNRAAILHNLGRHDEAIVEETRTKDLDAAAIAA